MIKASCTTQKGAALLLFMLLFVLGSGALVLGLSRVLYSDFLQQKLRFASMEAWYVADSGLEDMVYRMIFSKVVDSEEIFSYDGATATTTAMFDTTEEVYVVSATGTERTAYRTAAMSLYLGTGASFNFGVQSGNGGFTFTNGSSVQGNVFSNGRIEKIGGGNSWIYGDAISAGPAGLIKEVSLTGDAHAHTMSKNNIGGDAYYVTDSASTVAGTRYIGAADEATTTMPITDETIETIKQDVLDNGTIIANTDPECAGGTYVISVDTTLASTKIECNLEVQGNNTNLILTGTLWVEGDVSFKSGPNIIIASSVGARTVPIIADNETNRTTSSRIIIENSTSFAGSGSPKSYILLISQNNAAENGNTTINAIEVQQSSYGDLLVYASHGKILMGNSASLKEVTGYLIHLGNNADIIYESGLVNMLFTSGPGGGFTINGWREVY